MTTAMMSAVTRSAGQRAIDTLCHKSPVEIIQQLSSGAGTRVTCVAGPLVTVRRGLHGHARRRVRCVVDSVVRSAGRSHTLSPPGWQGPGTEDCRSMAPGPGPPYSSLHHAAVTAAAACHCSNVTAGPNVKEINSSFSDSLDNVMMIENSLANVSITLVSLLSPILSLYQ